MAPPMLDLLRRKPEELSEFDAIELLQQFGYLGPWVLDRRVLERAYRRWGHPIPDVSLDAVCGPGACAVLAVQIGQGLPCLRRAFAVPLRWVRQGMCPPGWRPVRGGLARVAAQVAETLKISGYELCICGHVSSEALAVLEDAGICTWNSGWLPLAIGLLTARFRSSVDPRTVATGAWEPEQGVTAVDCVRQKARLALDLGATTFLVPEANAEEVEHDLASCGLTGDLLSIVRVPAGEVDVWSLLRETVSPLICEPGPTASRDDLREYYLMLEELGLRNRAREFACQRIHPLIARDMRDEWLRSFGDERVDYLITVLSGSPEVCFYTTAAIRPRKAILVHTRGFEKHLDTVRALLEATRLRETAVDLEPFLVSDSAAFQEEVGRLRTQLPQAATVALDLTPGTKEMTLNLALDVARPGDLLVYIRHSMSNRAVIPFSQKLRVWRK